MNESFRADLHCHSTFSDGSDTPEDLILEAKRKGLSALSITDHDTIAAYERALPFAKAQNLPLLAGVEFSSSYKTEGVHILGYGFSLKSAAILELCERHKSRRQSRNLRILKKLQSMNIAITQEELSDQSTSTIGRPHIAAILMAKGVVGSIEEAFHKYLGEGKLAYVQGEPISVQETIDIIHAGGGVAIIAHPHLLSRASIRRALLTFPFDGLEGYYARLPHDREERWLNVAKEKGWMITGGSDYHGKTKPNSILGSSWVNEATFNILYAIHQKNNP